jgi:hypothetical protein
MYIIDGSDQFNPFCIAELQQSVSDDSQAPRVVPAGIRSFQHLGGKKGRPSDKRLAFSCLGDNLLIVNAM